MQTHFDSCQRTRNWRSLHWCWGTEDIGSYLSVNSSNLRVWYDFLCNREFPKATSPQIICFCVTFWELITSTHNDWIKIFYPKLWLKRSWEIFHIDLHSVKLQAIQQRMHFLGNLVRFCVRYSLGSFLYDHKKCMVAFNMEWQIRLVNIEVSNISSTFVSFS